MILYGNSVNDTDNNLFIIKCDITNIYIYIYNSEFRIKSRIYIEANLMIFVDK